MDTASLGYLQRDNCFTWLEDAERAPRLMDQQVTRSTIAPGGKNHHVFAARRLREWRRYRAWAHTLGRGSARSISPEVAISAMR
jgi:hypothetical protein